jgi:V/A-type H+-transporting ATPase subunit I
VVGYREFDVSAAFMVALPVFAAILIGDGGYGLLLTVALGLMYPKLAGKMGKEFLQLMIVIGVATTVWGFLSNSFFGAPLPFYPWSKPIIPVNMTQPSMDFMMKLSFIIGATHLSLAKLWQVIRLVPSLKALGSLGWGMIVWGMLGVIQMFLFNLALDWSTIWLWLLTIGASLAIVFDNPNRNVAKMIGMGVANFPLALLSAFSDVFSYVRLMAVGLASAVLAANFNEMASGVPFWPATVLILVLGHSLNLALCMIALFAHGVRLNMLEFSNNLGMQWTGQDYRPFIHRQHKETE